jgi:hypothetical protein
MTNTWQRFQNPVWQKAREQRKGTMGTAWGIRKSKSKPEREHEYRVKDWLFKNNLTEQLLLEHPSPDDIVLMREIRISYLWSYFTPSDVAIIANIENRIVMRRRSLTLRDRSRIELAVIRAQRLYNRQLKRISVRDGREQYQAYKQAIQASI